MSLDTVRAACLNIFRSGLVSERLDILWHAGEPLTVPPAFYRAAVELIEVLRPSDVTVSHQLQTNGTLLNPTWVNTLLELNIEIGVSIDGPADLHDRRRHSRKKAGTHSEVMRAISRLKSSGLPFYAICVLSPDSISDPDRLFHFFEDAQINDLAFNIDEVKGLNGHSSFDIDNAYARLTDFHYRYLTLIRRHNSSQKIRDMRQIIGALTSPSSDIKNLTNVPAAYISVSWDGYFSTFSPELLTLSHYRFPRFAFGHVSRNEIADLPKTALFSDIWSEIQAGIDACRKSCPYFTVCGGGSPASKIWENGTFNSTETLQCRLTVQSSTDAVLRYLTIESSLKGQQPE